MSLPSFNWRPNPGPQEQFHSSGAFELFYGGAAGGGKSESLLVEALRYVHVPGYSAVLFRRTFPELRQARGLIERSREYYPALGGRYNEQTFTWRFPAGSTIRFSQMEHEDDKYDHQSAEYAFIGFDELTTFLESQYTYLFSRARTMAVDPVTKQKVPVRIRAASNPGNVGHEFVMKRWGPWIVKDPSTGEPNAKPGEIRYFKSEDGIDVACDASDPDALSRQFIPAKLRDNPKLTEADPEYEKRLRMLSFIDRERLLNGSWDVLIQGNVFRAEWFKTLGQAPEGLKWIRYWDLAASTRTAADFSASAAIASDREANVYIRDMIRVKKEWPDVAKIIKTCLLTEEHVHRTGVEKKAHGLAAWQELMRDPDLVHKHIDAIDVDTDKLSRALIWSPRAETGKVFLVDGPWIPSFLLEATLFDGLGNTHDDQIDTISGGVLMLQPKWKRMKFLHL